MVDLHELRDSVPALIMSGSLVQIQSRPPFFTAFGPFGATTSSSRFSTVLKIVASKAYWINLHVDVIPITMVERIPRVRLLTVL